MLRTSSAARWALVGLLCGCKPGAGGEVEGTSGVSAEDTGVPTTGGECAQGACCCYSRDEYRVSTLCEVVELCPEIEVVCERGDLEACASAELEVVTVEAVDCALEALAAGEAGRISWVVDSPGGIGESRVSRVIDLVGDGTAVRHGVLVDDSVLDWFAVARIGLPPAAEFSACAAAPEVNARFECVRQLATAAADEVCIDAFSPPTEA